jgi:oxygen-independent coproporphyrinogen-3 oxidase
VEDARSAGFDNINIDLMHGLPGQSIAAALEDLRAAMDLEPTHLSWYQLTLEPNTIFYARPPAALPDEETAWEIQDQGQALLADMGYRQYEVSAYARDAKRCRHNLNYWLFGDYLAVGAGAHGKLTSAGGVYRYTKPANPLEYMQTFTAGCAATDLVQVPQSDLVFEFMLNALRLIDGFSEATFVERTGCSVDELARAMQPARQKGLVSRDADSVWRPTTLGRRFLNDLQAEFLPVTHRNSAGGSLC